MSDTNKSFDDYFNSNFEDGLSSPSKYILRFTYEAGQQSRQKEIDAAIVRIDNALDSAEIGRKYALSMGRIASRQAYEETISDLKLIKESLIS